MNKINASHYMYQIDYGKMYMGTDRQKKLHFFY